MAAKLFFVPSKALVNLNGFLAAGAELYFYESDGAFGSTTEKTVYSDSALTIPLPQPIRANPIGVYPNIYLDGAQTYRAKAIDIATGGTLFDLDPYFPMDAPFDQSELLTQLATAQSDITDIESRLYVTPEQYGAVGDGVTDDTAAIQAALNSGATDVVFLSPTYLVTGLTIGALSTIKKLRGFGRPVIQLVSAINAVALDIQKQQYVTIDGIDFRSGAEANIGTSMSDGNATIGVRSKIGASYLYFRNMRVAGFSQAGFQMRQTVNVEFTNVDGHNCKWAREYQPDTGNPCAATRIEGGYVTGCTSGDYSENGFTAGSIREVIYEYCGSASDEAGIRIKGGSVVLLGNYFESNGRNKWFTDCLVTQVASGNEYAATNPDVNTYVGTAFSNRGFFKVTNRSAQFGEWLPDPDVDFSVTTGMHLGGSGASLRIALNGTKILAVQQPAVVDATSVTYSAPSGGATVDAEARTSLGQLATDVADIRTQLNSLLARVRTHGLIAP